MLISQLEDQREMLSRFHKIQRMMITMDVPLNYNKNEFFSNMMGHTFVKIVRFTCIEQNIISMKYLQNIDIG